MDNAFEQLFTLTNVVFCLMVWVIVWLQRKGVEMVWKNAKDHKIWREVLLPFGPIGTGSLLAAIVPQYPFPEDFKSMSARVFFGAVCGMFSGTIYRVLKKFLENKAGGDASNGSAPSSP